MRQRSSVILLATIATATLASRGLHAQAFHKRSPNRYFQTKADNAATRLNERLERGDLEVPGDNVRGRLQGLLAALEVPETSQTLVFSKTSLQRHRISPENPRAIYFRDDVYVGWIPGAAKLEVIVGDDQLGLAFYSMPQDLSQPPRLTRDNSCLRCHASSRTHDEPGLLLRSVFTDAAGDPIASAGETDMDFRSPFAERWGGWIVTGQFAGSHRGNNVAHRDARGNWQVAAKEANDLHAFADRFDAARYLQPTSDIGALLALEQQSAIHNLMVRASHQVRYLVAKDEAIRDLAAESGPPGSSSTKRITDSLAKQIAALLLLDGEATLRPHAARSHAAFASDFEAQWPKDQSGVRLGRLDLSERTFALPLSPMIHSPAFARMPTSLRQSVIERLYVAIVRGVPPGSVRLDQPTRTTLANHLTETLPGWPKAQRKRPGRRRQEEHRREEHR